MPRWIKSAAAAAVGSDHRHRAITARSCETAHRKVLTHDWAWHFFLTNYQEDSYLKLRHHLQSATSLSISPLI